MDAKTIDLLNIIVHSILFLALIYSFYLSRKKKDLITHCRVLRIAGFVLIADTLAVMLPAMLDYFGPGIPINAFAVEIIVHHSVGVLLLLIWIFVNLVMLGVIKFKRRLRGFMWVATGAWVTSFLLGVHLYLATWTQLLG